MNLTQHVDNVLSAIITDHQTIINHEAHCDVEELSEKDIKQLMSFLFDHHSDFKEHVKDYIDDMIQDKLGWKKIRR